MGARILDRHINEFFRPLSEDRPQGGFHKVVALHEAPDIGWEQVASITGDLPKGWFEVSQLASEDRIDFISSFWFKQLPFRPRLKTVLTKFFSQLDDIGIFLTQKKEQDPFEVQMVYSVTDDSGFFRGNPPAKPEEIASLASHFREYMLPKDFLAFLNIHDGFFKYLDTGILKSSQIPLVYEMLQKLFSNGGELTTKDGEAVSPKGLIPFYESFGMPSYQCFWGEWYPEDEMGNVYLSGVNRTVSSCKRGRSFSENLAFPTFLDWLMFYLERVE